MDSRIILRSDEMPRQWYNVAADLPGPLSPPLHPQTLKPCGPEDLAPIFPMSLIEQEVSQQRWIDIPDEILEILSLWRPTPLVRAYRLEKALGTPAEIYYKNESVSPAGSHKPNTAVVQAYYNKKEGVKKITTETGAGQWGSALSFACNLIGLECTIYMVKVSFQQKPYRKSLMRLWGGKVIPSPSDTTNCGRAILAQYPDSPGSLGIAISEAIEIAATNDDTKYSLGSVLNHVLLHQTVVGLETKAQLKKVSAKPDIMIGCVGGGSNFAGFIFPFIPDKLEGKNIRFVAVEPTACPTLTSGKYTYDYGDTAKMTPLIKMHTLGHDFIPEPIHAGGLRYHGDAPLLSAAVNANLVEAIAVRQTEVFDAACLFARTEGIVPAPETSHALRVTIDEALKCKQSGEKKVIVLNFSGHGHFDMSSYDAYFDGKLQDYQYPKERIEESLARLPKVE